METPGDMERPDDHDERMKVARRKAQWYLGDPSWANELIGAYLYPKFAQEELDKEMGEEA